MSLLNWRTWLFAIPLAFLVGCTTVNSNEGTVTVTIQGQFEKRTLTPSGFGPTTTTLPIRHSYAEVRQANGDALIASGYLGKEGVATLDVTPGTQLYAIIYADYEALVNPTDTVFFMRGGVLKRAYGTTPTSSGYSPRRDEWTVTSDTVTVNSSGTLTVTATAASRIAGAFNINDQMLTQGLALSSLDPTLRLPNLFTYWTTSSNPGDQSRNYPTVLQDASNKVITHDGRAVFIQSLNGLQGGGADTETDEWDDGVIQENSAHMLFADYSLKSDGSSSLSLLRRDNDNVQVARYDYQSESTVAFVGGFCDFLAGALRNNPLLLNSYVSGSGQQVETFDLRLHNQVTSAVRSEFTRGSIAVSLWGIWQNALGGSTSGLQTMWQAVWTDTPSAPKDGTGEYNGGALGCYPTYLQGVKNRANTSAWPAIVAQLALEDIREPNPGYFTTTALWQTRTSVPFTVTGSLQTYANGLGIYYDRNQSQAYRFTQSLEGSRTITMTPTGGQDFWVEVLGPGNPGGVWASSTDGGVGTRSFTTVALPVGVYTVRVRAGNTTATGSFGYTLSVQ
ncbi:MAG: hypothetical protein IPP78_05635 [Holophagaceae bacterium]|nr:hypothetical protein [Holophagaceae bacterium]